MAFKEYFDGSQRISLQYNKEIDR